MAEVGSQDRDPLGPQNLKCLLSDPLQIKFANYSLRKSSSVGKAFLAFRGLWMEQYSPLPSKWLIYCFQLSIKTHNS